MKKFCERCNVYLGDVRSIQRFCKPCAKIRDKESKRKYYEANMELAKAREKQRQIAKAEEIRKQKREYYQNNIDEIRKKDKQRYEKERERRIAYSKKYYNENKDEISIREAKKYQENPDKFKNKTKQWNKNNPDKVREQSRIKRVRKRNAFGSHTIDEFYEVCVTFRWECAYCGEKVTKRTVTEDHIIPLVKGGTDNIENIVPACWSCNSSKQDKDFTQWYKMKPFYNAEKEHIVLIKITDNGQFALF